MRSFSPPHLQFLTKLYHCNVASTGAICELGGFWPTLHIEVRLMTNPFAGLDVSCRLHMHPIKDGFEDGFTR